MNFIRIRGWFFIFSALLILPGIVFLIIAPGLKPGIDFTGGSTLTIQVSNSVDQEDIRNELSTLGHPDATVQKLEAQVYFIRTKELDEIAKKSVLSGIETNLSPEGVTELSFDLVKPIVAAETVRNALYAVIAAAVGIFIYIWWAFRTVPSPFRYGLAAIVALIHDTIIVIGIFAILGVLIDLEVGTMFLIAILTVIGYSVNDTIVVFDRIRENVSIFPNRGLGEVVNLSISETIGRSLNTSITLLITLMALMLFGGSTIREFLLVLLIGLVSGTYSSIGIASQVLVSWEYGDFGRVILRRKKPQANATA